MDVEGNLKLRLDLSQASPIPLQAKLECWQGQTTALVGPSGSGKTTILRSIAGLYSPKSGRISCGGEIWLDTAAKIDLPTQKRRVGMMFQDYALFPHKTVLENVALGLGTKLTRVQNPEARELLKRVNLDGLETRYPCELSGGQSQRVALARALARRPNVLLLDEPFAAVDQVTRRKLRLEMKRITQQLNIPIILVTHDLDEACMMADQMCVLHGGTTLQVGKAEQVLSKPVDPVVARLVDIRNSFEAVVAELKPEREVMYLNWAGYTLEANFVEGYSPGDKICWCIPPKGVLLHSRIRRSNGERENPINGIIKEMVTINGLTSMIVEILPTLSYKLNLDLPDHVVDRNSLLVGEEIGVSLLKNSLHLMRYRPDIRSS